MRVRRDRLVLSVTLGLLIVGLVPYRTTSVPEWKIRVVDPSQQPVAFTTVRQEWRHAGVLGLQSELKETDHDGVVVFPERKLVAPLILRVGINTFDAVNNFAMAHGAANGVFSRVLCPEGPYYWLEYTPDREMKHELVFKKFD